MIRACGLSSRCQDQPLRNIGHIPYPERPYLEVCGMLFGSNDDQVSATGEPDAADD
jgi:hypothetical protein